MVRNAYTLFELVLVMALLVLMAAIAYPSLDSMYGDFRLTQASDMIRACWAEARTHAVEEGRPYRFAVIPNKGNYRVAPDGVEFWSGGGDALVPGAQYVLEETLPRGVRFATGDAIQSGGLETGNDSSLPVGAVDPGSWTTIVTFLPDGTARDDVEIVFNTARARPLILKLRALTGAVTVRPAPMGR